MLTPDARGPGPSRPPAPRGTPVAKSRVTGARIGLGILVVLAALFFALRGADSEPAPRGSQPSARGGRERPSTLAQGDVPRGPRVTARESDRSPRARVSAGVADAKPPQLQPDAVSDPALKMVLAARDDRSDEGTRTLTDNLTSRDPIVVAEAARALVARQATEAITQLAAIRLDEAAGSGLSVIAALGKLGAVANEDEKSTAVDRLLSMLRTEKRRDARESPGNLLQIYEALGDTRDPGAAPALEAELLDATVPRAPKVVIVHALLEIGMPSSKDALRAAHGEQSAQRGSDAFEEEIRQELVAALEEALETL